MNFLRNHWFDLGGFLALLVLFFVYTHQPTLTPYELLMWISLMSLLAHQLEEYRIVGTFPGMLNKAVFKSTMPDRYPMNTNTAVYINVILGWPIYFLAAFFAEKAVWLGLASILVSLGNTVAHTFVFNLKGKTVYNAGMATSWVLFVPISYYFFTILYANRLVTTQDYLIGIPLGIIFNAVGILKTIDWLKDRNTAYVFPQRCLLPADRNLKANG